MALRAQPGLREIFDYRDLDIKDGTEGAYVAYIIRANGRNQRDEVQHWHVHECAFQFVPVLNGWAARSSTRDGAAYAPHGRRGLAAAADQVPRGRPLGRLRTVGDRLW